MHKPVSSQTRATALSSRERLREAAKALFAQRGYEGTSTAAICRLAGTSQSQLIKHFTNKQGLLEAILENAWEHINPAVSLAIEQIPSPRDKVKIVVDMLLSFLEKDPEMRVLFLLEGRRLRGDEHKVFVVTGFLHFVKMVDGILNEMIAAGELLPGLPAQALRSALMGAVEGMLRDKLLARPNHIAASYSEADVRAVLSQLLDCCLTK